MELQCCAILQVLHYLLVFVKDKNFVQFFISFISSLVFWKCPINGNILFCHFKSARVMPVKTSI